MFYGATSFSTIPLSSLGVRAIKATSVLNAVGTLVADGIVSYSASATIEAVAILEPDGSLTLAGNADLVAVASLFASITTEREVGKICIWTAPARATTWSFPEEYNGNKLIWVVPTGVGATNWSSNIEYSDEQLIWTIPTGVGANTWTLPPCSQC